MDCAGIIPYWNNEITDIFFTDPVAVCGVYRLELQDWGGYLWELLANCSGTRDPGFMIFDNYADAAASLTLYPELSIWNLEALGICPDYTVRASVTNTGCIAADAVVCVETSLGGHWEFTIFSIAPGDTGTGSTPIVAPGCTTPFKIIATVDCHDTVIECNEGGGSAIPCILPGTHDNSIEIDMLGTSTPTSILSPTPTRTIYPGLPLTPNYVIELMILLCISLIYAGSCALRKRTK